MGRGTCSTQHEGLQRPPLEHVTLAGGKEFYKTRVCSVHRSVSGRTGLGTRTRDKAEEGPFDPAGGRETDGVLRHQDRGFSCGQGEGM